MIRHHKNLILSISYDIAQILGKGPKHAEGRHSASLAFGFQQSYPQIWWISLKQVNN
jgi:hypothetical protein